MYNSYFGFKEKPFKLVPNPDYLFLSKSHEIALAHLNYATEQGDGFVVITGEVGTGKTTLCRNYLESLDEKTASAYIFNPRLDSEQLLASICQEFGIQTEETRLKGLLDLFNAFLIDQKAAGNTVVVLIDEAQGLSVENLELVRMLSNLETTRSKLLQIILVGQPELGETLDSYELRQLAQRISLNYHLSPLTAKETEAYIQHRLEIASQRQTPLISANACRSAYHYSGGIPRLINIVCDRALLLAYSQNRPRVTRGIMQAAIRELLTRGQTQPQQKHWHLMIGGAALLCAVAIAVAVYVWIDRGSRTTIGAEQQPREAVVAKVPPVTPPTAEATGEKSGKNVTVVQQNLSAGADGAPQMDTAAGQKATAGLIAQQTGIAPDKPALSEPEPDTHGQALQDAASQDADALLLSQKADLAGDHRTEAAVERPEPSTAIPATQATGKTANHQAATQDIGPAPPDPAKSEIAREKSGLLQNPARPEPFEDAQTPEKLPLAIAVEGLERLGSRKNAVRTILSDWGQPRPTVDLLPAQLTDPLFIDLAARQYGLRAYTGPWRWDLVQMLDLPAIVTLLHPGSGQQVYLALIGRKGDRLRLSDGDDSHVIETDLETLTPFIGGPMYLLWRNVLGFDMLIGHGANQRAILGVQKLLRQAGFDQLSLSSVFDSATADAVRTFQRKHNLNVDGLVGPLTKMMLLRVAGGNAMPDLTSRGDS